MEIPLRFGFFEEGEMPPLVGDTVKLPSPRKSEMVSVHFRSISGGSVTLQKPLHEVNLADLKKEIEHCDGIPPSLQRVTHRGKDLHELADLHGLFDGYASSAKEIEVSVTLRVMGGMFGRSAKKECNLVWDLKKEPILAGTNLPPARCYKVSKPTELVEGTYTYWPPLDRPMVPGNGQQVSVKFTPSSKYYDPVELVETIDVPVVKQRPVIDWTPPSAIEYGTKLSAEQLNATCATTHIKPEAWQYDPPLGTVLSVGTHVLKVWADPMDTVNYSGTDCTVVIQVFKSVPAVEWRPALAVTVGQKLTAEGQLNARSEVPGTFSYDRAVGDELDIGKHEFTMTFTPEDAANYSPVTQTITLVVKNHAAVDMEYVKDFAETMPECTHKHLLMLRYALNDAFNYLADASKLQAVYSEVDCVIAGLKKDGRWNDRVEAQIKIFTTSLQTIAPGKKVDITGNLRVVFILLCPFDILEFSELVKKASISARALQDKHVVLLFGKTGCGKSTTINYLAGATMRPCADSVEVEAAIEALASFKISSAGSSETRYINAIPIMYRGEEVWLCDTAGFDDTEGPEVDISNGMGLISAANACASVRPLVLINRLGGGRAEEFASVCKNVSAMLSTNLNAYINKFTFGVTRLADEEYLSKYLATAATINLLAADQKIVRSVIIDEKHRDGLVHAVMPCAGDARRQRFLAQLLDEANMIDRPKDVFKYYYTSQSEGRVTQQLNDMRQLVVHSLERGDYKVAQFNIEQMLFLRSLLKESDPDDKFNIERATAFCIKEVEKRFEEFYVAASTELTRCTEDGNKLTVSDLTRYKEKLALFLKVHTETTILTFSPDIRQYSALEQDVVTAANRILQSFCPSADSAQSRLTKLRLLSEQMNALMTLHPDVLVKIHSDALQMCDDEITERTKAAKLSYTEACAKCAAIGDTAAGDGDSKEVVDEFVQSRWKTFCSEYEKVARVTEARNSQLSFTPSGFSLIDEFDSYVRSFVEQQLSSCSVVQGQACAADNAQVFSNLIYLVDSFDNSAMSAIERLRDLRSDVKTDVIDRISEFITRRIEMARNALSASSEPDFDQVTLIVAEVNKLRNLRYVGVQTADQYHELRSAIVDTINKLIGEANTILQQLQPQAVVVRVTNIAEQEAFLEKNPYASFGLCLNRLKAANNWIDASTRESLLRRITQEVLTHVKTSAQVIESCNILKLKNYGNIRRVNLKLKDVEYLRQSIDNYLVQYNTDADKLFHDTHRVVISAFRSIQSGCEFDDKAENIDSLNQSINFESFEIALRYLEECENNFSELDRADQKLLLKNSAEAGEGSQVTMAQSKKHAMKHLDDHIRQYKKMLTGVISDAKKKISPNENGEAADAPVVPDTPPAMVRMNSITLQQMARFNQAVNEFKNIFALFNMMEQRYPHLHSKMDAPHIKEESIAYFEQVIEQLDLEIQRRSTEDRSIAQQLERALYLRRLDTFVFANGASNNFNRVYNAYFNRGVEIVQAANQELKDGIQRYAFGDVTVERISSFTSADARKKILSLLQGTYDEFSETIDNALQTWEMGLDPRTITPVLNNLAKFDQLKPLYEKDLVEFDVGYLKESFHTRLVALLVRKLGEVNEKMEEREFSDACALKDSVAAAINSTALSTNPLYKPVLMRIADFDKQVAEDVATLARNFEKYSVDEIILSHQPVRVFTSLGTALLNFKLDAPSSTTLFDRLKQILEAKFADAFTKPMAATPLGDFDETFQARMQGFMNVCPQDMARAFEAKAAECKRLIQQKVALEITALQQHGDGHSLEGLKAAMNLYATYVQPKINPDLTRELRQMLASIEKAKNTQVTNLMRGADKREGGAFADFQTLCYGFRDFYKTFSSILTERPDSVLRLATTTLSKRLSRDCAALGSSTSSAKDARSALVLLADVIQAYDSYYYETVYQNMPITWVKDDFSIVGNIREAFTAFVSRFMAEHEQFAIHLKRNQVLAKKSFADLKALEPSLVIIKRLSESRHDCLAFFTAQQQAFLGSWVSIDSQFTSLRGELHNLSSRLRAQKFLEYTFKDSNGATQVLERSGATDIAEFYAELFSTLKEMVNISATISMNDPTACEPTLRQVGEHLNAQCNLVRTKIKESLTVLHLATKSDDFRVFNMCYNHFCGMLRHDFGKFSEELSPLFPGVETDLAEAKTVTMSIVSGSLDTINLLTQQINDESVKFNNDRKVREDYAIPMYREVLRVHLYSVNLAHLTSTLQTSLNQTFNNMKNSNDKGRKMIIYLGTYLKANTDGMDPHGVGQDVMETYTCFDNFMNSVFEGRTKAQDIKYVLDNLRVNAGSQFNRPDIEAYYKQFHDTFYKTMNDHLIATEEHIDAIVFEIKRTAAKFSVGQIQNHHAVIPDVLAKIFALWSLMSAGQLDANETNTVTEFHKKPHPVQIVAIFQMLGMSGSLTYYQKFGITSQNVIANHFVQIGTGEGKSVVLAMTSIIVALFGYDVNCASYSALLSDRDYDAFLNVFRKLDVEQYITYGTFYTLCENVINENGDVRDLLKNAVLPTCKPIDCRKSTRPRILLIDEVDVFFKEDFYGECYAPLADIGIDDLPQIEPLTDWIWANRADTNMTLAMVKAAKADVGGVQVEIYKALEAALVGYADLLEEVVKSMICHVQSFTKYKWIVKGGKIAYKEQDSYSDKITYGYRTMFAYYHEFEQSNLPLENLRKAKKISLRCGSFSFAEIPKRPNFAYILGVTGTLEFLSSYETNILEKEYDIRRQSYMPSAYGIRADKLDYAPTTVQAKPEDQHIRLTESEDHFKVICEQIAKFVGFDVGTRRAVLVFFDTEEQLRLFEKESALNVYRNLKVLNVIVEQLDTLEKTKLIREASSAGRVTLLTKAFGRGIDFFCKDQEVVDNKGVVVLHTFLSDNISEEIQIKGRTARQGQYGAYRMILEKKSLELYLIRTADLACAVKDLERLLNTKRDEFYKTTYANNRSDVKKAEVLHKLFLKFIQDMLAKNKTAVQTFLKAENKAEVMLSLGKGGTLILLDATGSMSHCMKNAKSKVSEIFSLAFQVLEKHEIPTGSITLQFGAYRNYSSAHDLLFQVSKWENNANNLLQFLKPIEVSGGMGNEAMEVGLEWAAREAEAKRLAQVIVIGDIGANTRAEVTGRRARSGEKYWLDHGFPNPIDAETQLARLKACNVPVYPFYVCHSAKAAFESYAALTGGTAAFLDVNSTSGGELLTDFITERVLYSIGGENGAALVTSYKEVAAEARAKGYSR